MVGGYVFQVLGRLRGYRSVDYIVCGGRHRAVLVADALRECMGQLEVCLVVPESLVAEVAGCPEEAGELLRDRRRLAERFREEVEECGLVSGKFRVIVAQSVGAYTGGSCGRLVFNNHLDNVVAYLLLDLLGLDVGPGSLVICDASTGHNVYVAALLEAVRTMLVYHKLRRIVQGERGPECMLSIVPPVLARDGEDVPVGLYEYDVKAFFEFPLRSGAASPLCFLERGERRRLGGTEVGRELCRALDGACKRINELVHMARLAFNALKYNVPLTLFHRELVDLSEADPGEGLEALGSVLAVLEGLREVRCGGGGVAVSRLRVNRSLVANVALTMALLESLRLFWEEKVRGVEPRLGYIRDVFTEVYGRLGLGLNSRFLERDIKELMGVGEGKKWALDPKRNFFAHSGFLKDYIAVEGERVSYKGGRLSEIRGWLRSPEG